LSIIYTAVALFYLNAIDFRFFYPVMLFNELRWKKYCKKCQHRNNRSCDFVWFI